MTPKTCELFKKLLPPLNKTERNDLMVSILENGQIHPIVTCEVGDMDGVYILDGHNRFEILTELNIEPKYEPDPRTFKCKEEAMIWIIENQILKRNVKSYVRACLSLRKKDLISAIAKKNMGLSPGRPPKEEPDFLKKPLVGSGKYLPDPRKEKGLSNSTKVSTRKQLAKEAGVGEETLYRIEKIEAEGSEDLKERCREGKIKVNAAYKELRGLNSDEPPVSEIDKLIEKTYDLSQKIFAQRDVLDLDQREHVFESVELLNQCVHEPEECIPNIRTFGETYEQDYL